MILQEIITLLQKLQESIGILLFGFCICVVIQIAFAIATAVLWHRFQKLPAQQFAKQHELTMEQVIAYLPGAVPVLEQDQQETIFITEAGRQALEKIYMDHQFHQLDKEMRDKRDIQ